MHTVSSPRNDDESVEHEIQRKGKTAARVTPADLEASIAGSYTFTAYAAVGPDAPRLDALKLLTICVLVLRNGFTVTGESACASPENFDAEIGARIARENAKQKVWPLLGYALKERLHEAQQPFSPTSEGGRYTGTKTLRAWPMTRGAYNEYRSWAAPEGEDQSTPGYLVEYEDGGAANDSRHVGYISWSPADVFERSYRAA